MMRKIISFFMLATCAAFIVAGAANQGFSGFTFALPFAAVFLYLLKRFSLKVRVIALCGIVLMVLPFAWQHEENTIIYPWIGDEFIASCGWEAITYGKEFTGYQYATLVFEGDEVDKKHLLSRRPISCEATWALKRVLVRHPDLSTQYYPVFSIDGFEATMSGRELNTAFQSGRLTHAHIRHSYDLQSEWTQDLSQLMMWPSVPISLLTRLQMIFSSSGALENAG
ncbi:hypothetical protein [Vibrio navarrensis]|uniref:hypothetical protein n=1 Tax=Vibrio navarrensis TaxID=29495 RepID=UPI0020945297|nr:hypothetical protein [Vibrio navarrensis]